MTTNVNWFHCHSLFQFNMVQLLSESDWLRKLLSYCDSDIKPILDTTSNSKEQQIPVDCFIHDWHNEKHDAQSVKYAVTEQRPPFQVDNLTSHRSCTPLHTLTKSHNRLIQLLIIQQQAMKYNASQKRRKNTHACNFAKWRLPKFFH